LFEKEMAGQMIKLMVGVFMATTLFAEAEEVSFPTQDGGVVYARSIWKPAAGASFWRMG